MTEPQSAAGINKFHLFPYNLGKAWNSPTTTAISPFHDDDMYNSSAPIVTWFFLFQIQLRTLIM
jgi:hypothetical protein